MGLSQRRRGGLAQSPSKSFNNSRTATQLLVSCHVSRCSWLLHFHHWIQCSQISWRTLLGSLLSFLFPKRIHLGISSRYFFQQLSDEWFVRPQWQQGVWSSVALKWVAYLSTRSRASMTNSDSMLSRVRFARSLVVQFVFCKLIELWDIRKSAQCSKRNTGCIQISSRTLVPCYKYSEFSCRSSIYPLEYLKRWISSSLATRILAYNFRRFSHTFFAVVASRTLDKIDSDIELTRQSNASHRIPLAFLQ